VENSNVLLDLSLLKIIRLSKNCSGTNALTYFMPQVGNEGISLQRRHQRPYFSHVQPLYERAVSDLDRSMHRSLWV
jgi:hypothetical protein